MTTLDPNSRRLIVTKVNDGIVIELSGHDEKMLLPHGAHGKLIAMLTKAQQVDRYTGIITVNIKTLSVYTTEQIENELK